MNRIIMKLGIVISTQPTSFSALSYAENLEESIKKAADMGYDGVELAVREPDLLDVEKVKKILNKYNLNVPAIGTGQAFVEEGLSFTSPDEDIRKKAVKRIKAHTVLAEKLDTHVIIGLIRGRGDDSAVSVDQKIEWLDEAMNECAGFAAAEKITLFVEPLNRYETSLINTISQGIELIERLSHKNIKLLIDTFHMNIEEPSLYASIVKASPYLGHVHFADSNRWYPGNGHLDFKEIVNILIELDYKGYISMEMLPLPSADKAAEMSIDYLKGIIETIN